MKTNDNNHSFCYNIQFLQLAGHIYDKKRPTIIGHHINLMS